MIVKLIKWSISLAPFWDFDTFLTIVVNILKISKEEWKMGTFDINGYEYQIYKGILLIEKYEGNEGIFY